MSEIIEALAHIIDPEAFGRRTTLPAGSDYLTDRDEARWKSQQIIAAIGIPAATLAGLRDGSLVAVPREPTRKQWDRVAEMCYAVPESTWQLRAEAIWPEVVQAFAVLAAAQEPGHE